MEKIVPPSFIKMKNSKNQTPKEQFAEEHKKLLKEGEKWMKSTATSCITTKKMLISDQEFMTDPKSPLKKAYL